jgi:propanol-preferring alcohol dehydrogenase
MRAMVLESMGAEPRLRERPVPEVGPGDLLVRIAACGVCRTDLHVADGELPEPALPVVLGHEVVGTVEAVGSEVTEPEPGDRVGVPWLGWTCGECRFCTTGRENLCPRARFTGYTRDGGFAEYVAADARYCFRVPGRFEDVEAAPLLCAGLIGFRSYRLAGDGPRLGFYGFGAAAHILCQIAVHEGREVFAFTRPGDESGQAFATRLGAVWAGGSGDAPPVALDAAIIFAPVGDLVPAALQAVEPGGRVVCAGIHMSDVPSFPYRILWKERSVVSVANLTRQDGIGFMAAVQDLPLRTSVEVHPLVDAALAMRRLRDGDVEGAAVLVP